MQVTVSGKRSGVNARVLVVIDGPRVRADFGETATSWAEQAESFVQSMTGMRPFRWVDGQGTVTIGDSAMRDAYAGEVDATGLPVLPEAKQAVTVDKDQVLIIRLNSGVSAEQARQFRDVAVHQAQEAGIRMLVVVADEIAAATATDADSPVIGYRVAGRLYDPAEVTIVRHARRFSELIDGPDLGDDPDGDNTPGMGDH